MARVQLLGLVWLRLEQPVGALFYQWVGCRDHAGIACFPHSGSWHAQGGPAYISKDQRKHVFHNMGPLSHISEQNAHILMKRIDFHDLM